MLEYFCVSGMNFNFSGMLSTQKSSTFLFDFIESIILFNQVAEPIVSQSGFLWLIIRIFLASRILVKIFL